jgi:peptide/nickel transport system permease protein
MMPRGVQVLVKQLAAVLAAVLLSTFLIYSSLYFVPGDTLRILTGGRAISAAARRFYINEYHLNSPFFVRYFDWLGAALQGNFGRSLISGDSVSVELRSRAGTTVLLLLMATLLMIVFGVAAGLLEGLAKRRLAGFTSLVTSLALAIPPFVAAALLITVFAVGLGWFPVLGNGNGLADEIYHLVLPAVALSLGGGAYIARITRVAVRHEAGSEHVETARSRGLSRSLIVRRHILRNALLPVTTVAGLTVAGLIAGTVVVESAFGLNGLGSLLVQSVLDKDFTVVQAVSLILVIGFIAVNLIVDLLYLVIDPRLRARSAT